MGLLKAAAGALGGVVADQWREYFYCDALPADVLVTKGRKRTSRRSSNTKGVGWTCACGTVNKGKFCPNCGARKPAGAPLYRCDKCGWEPEDPRNPPRFCPECGDPFDDNDKQ